MATETPQPEDDGHQSLKNEDILATLCTKADLERNIEVRDCLRAYKLDAQLKTHRTAFNKFTKDVLIKTLLFLNAAPEGNNWNSLLKSNIANELICRIQNLLLDKCGVCGCDFATALEEKLLLICEICGQNMHTPCLQNLLGGKYHENITRDEVLCLINPLGVQGFHYLCSTCSNSTIPKNSLQTMENACITIKNNPMNLANSDIPNIDLTTTHGDGNTSNALSNSACDKTWRERPDLCSLFLQGTCPNGISGKNCANFHPRVCNRYRKNGSHPKYGCSLGNACKLYHPDICPNSMKSHTCYNSDCSYRWHLPRTKRIAQSTYGASFKRKNYWGNGNFSGQQRSNSNNYSFGKRNQKPYYNSNKNRTTQYSFDRHVYNREYRSGTRGHGEGVGGQQHPSRTGHTLDESHRYSNTYNNDTAFINNNSFLENLVQETVAEKIQTALQQLNIPGQILQQLTQIQTPQTSENMDQKQQDKQTTHLIQDQMNQLNGLQGQSALKSTQYQDQRPEARLPQGHLTQTHLHQDHSQPVHPLQIPQSQTLPHAASQFQNQMHMYPNQQILQHY